MPLRLEKRPSIERPSIIWPVDERRAGAGGEAADLVAEAGIPKFVLGSLVGLGEKKEKEGDCSAVS